MESDTTANMARRNVLATAAAANSSLMMTDATGDEEREVMVARLVSLDVSESRALALLESTSWVFDDALEICRASKLDLSAPPPPGPANGAAGASMGELVTLPAGCVNCGNSCYIDSVLFACFATNDAYDSLLVKRFSGVDVAQLQV